MTVMINDIRVTIELTQDKVCFADEYKWQQLREYKWTYNAVDGTAITRYVAEKGCYIDKRWGNKIDRYGTISMHRLLLGAEDGVTVEHIDGNKLNNCMANLRITEKKKNTIIEVNNGILTIELTMNKVCFVSEDKWPNLELYKWHYNNHCRRGENNGYAVATIVTAQGYYNTLTPTRRTYNKTGLLPMHRLILDTPADMQVDHIDGNKLNNVTTNLRIATNHQNQFNKPKQAKSNMTSPYKGVTYRKNGHCWQGRIRVNGKNINLGYFDTELEAALAYNKAASLYHGEFACLNIIP